MKRIELDFHHGRAGARRAGGWALLVVGLLVVIALMGHFNKLRKEQQRIKTTLAQQAERQQASSARVDVKELEPQFQQAAAVIERIAFPWNRLFKVLESSAGEDVVLLSVHPDVAGGTVTLNAEARDWNAMLDYIRRLGEDKFFTDVHLVSHQIQANDPQQPVRFVLSCAWVSTPIQMTPSR